MLRIVSLLSVVVLSSSFDAHLRTAKVALSQSATKQGVHVGQLSATRLRTIDLKGDPAATGKRTFWPPEEGNSLVAWIFAGVFVVLIASVPIFIHLFDEGASWWPSKVVAAQGFALFTWLITGIVCFTQLCNFQSPHFGGVDRTLTLVEAVYLFSQILTTVGYGDITPSETGGQLFVGFFVFCAISIIAGMVSEISTIILERAQHHLQASVQDANKHIHEHDGQAVIGAKAHASWKPLAVSLSIFSMFVVAGIMFFTLYPGENKTLGQAMYMSIITLTTVGFGVYTPETSGGMVFAAFWMVLGVATLAWAVASFTELLVELRQHDAGHHHLQDDVLDEMLRREFSDRNGRVDELGFLRYALLKYDFVGKKQLDGISKQFEELRGLEAGDTRRDGTISCQLVQSLSTHVK